MKAAQLNNYGDSSVIQINDVDIPTVSQEKVLVEVYAASLNPFDTMVREGYAKSMMSMEPPFTLGADIAGVVSQVGADVSRLAIGDKVYGSAGVVGGGSGGLAEYALVSVGDIAESPANLNFEQSASLPLVGSSALQALAQHIHLEKDQKLFIHGGAGGIGTIAIQIAKHIGAYVATTATGDNVAYVKQLGADEVIDYKSQDFSEILKDYDAVFDTVGGDDFNKSFVILKEGGIAVSMIAQPDEENARSRDITAIMQHTSVTSDSLSELAELVEQGVVVPQVGKVFSLDQAKEAFEARESGAVHSKVVVAIK